MLWLTDSFEAIRDFMELGGPVLRWIALVIFLMWVLIVERILYFRTSMRTHIRKIVIAISRRTGPPRIMKSRMASNASFSQSMATPLAA